MNGNGKLLTDIDRNGNAGLGHPEPLKGNLAGWWSREIDEKNRKDGRKKYCVKKG